MSADFSDYGNMNQVTKWWCRIRQLAHITSTLWLNSIIECCRIEKCKLQHVLAFYLTPVKSNSKCKYHVFFHINISK